MSQLSSFETARLEHLVTVGGDLFRQSNILKTWARRRFEIRGKNLLEMTARGEKSRIFLPTNTQIDVFERSGRPFCFSIAVPAMTKALVLSAETAEEREAWVGHLEAAARMEENAGDLRPRRVDYEDFDLLAVIGRGTYGKVQMVRHRMSGQLFAMKSIKKQLIKEEGSMTSLLTERDVLLSNSHPFLVTAHWSFQTETKLVIVMDFVPGGELFQRLRVEVRLPVDRVRLICAEIVLALEYLHERGYIYRDLKPENILFDESGHVKITDFGYSKRLRDGAVSTDTFCGTPDYIAPEVILSVPHTKAVDWWALGCVTYEMLVGQTPFSAESPRQMFRAIVDSPVRFPAAMDAKARDFIGRLLDKAPDGRLGAGPNGAEEVKAHGFFTGLDWQDVLHRRIEPKWKPRVRVEGDVNPFDAEFTREAPVRSVDDPKAIGSPAQRMFNGFTVSNETYIPPK